MKCTIYFLIAIGVMSVVVDTLPIGVSSNNGETVGVRGNLLYRIKRSVIISGICPEGTVWKGQFFGCITCERYTEYTGEPC